MARTVAAGSKTSAKPARRRPAARKAATQARTQAANLLKRYNEKRRFDLTSEPRGEAAAAASGDSFVIQQHDATRMHFDFRLELDGVLKSWAVPKGPSLSVHEKRLAVQTEDHPLGYREFEGSIPHGEYGGGPVIVWDRGRWQPEGDAGRGLAKGNLSFTLAGEKLHGRYTLVRMRGTPGPKSNWLLIKRSDEHAREGPEAEITARLTQSVVSGRTVQQVAAGVATPEKPRRAPASSRASARTAAVPGTVAGKRAPATARMPRVAELEPQLATLVDRPPVDERYGYEVKYDGYRLLIGVDRGKAEIRSRNHLDWTSKFATVARAVETLKVKQAVLDGELCYVKDDGRTDFQHLQNTIGMGDGDKVDHRRLVFYVFDLLFLDGEDLRPLPLSERKQRLQALMLTASKGQPLQFSEHLSGDARTILTQACQLGLEGVIGKRLDRPYREGRGSDWIKLKCQQRQEFVIVGMLPSEARSGFRSLLLGVRENGRLQYRGKVGTGFDARSLLDISRRLRPLVVDKPMVEGAPRLHKAIWVKPELVGEVSYTEVTRDGSLRHPSFQGLRLDKPAQDVVAEKPVKLVTLPAGKKARSSAAKPAAAARNLDDPTVGGVRISSPGRVIDAASGITKLQLAHYHERVHDLFLAYGADRPLALVRCPQGHAQQCFFQKHAMAGLGKDVKALQLNGKDALAVSSPAGIYQLVQFNVVELHGWGSRMPAHAKPDWIIFDLDPDEGLGFDQVIDAALQLRELLGALKLKTFVKTTGGKGLHVVVPLTPKAGWTEVAAFSRHIAESLAQMEPQRYVATMSKAKRKGRIFVDYLRNAPGSTAILPYSPRARPGLPVAVPVEWKDLKGLNPREFTVANIAQWLKRKRDPWAGLWSDAPELPDLAQLLQR
jgi:bifunctional non-homologous end joining protein LigD